MTCFDAAVTSVAVHVPPRACDVGGWTDTWFAQHGRVCSLAVGPAVTVRAVATPGDRRVTVDAVDYGLVLAVGSEPVEHRLLAEAVREAGALDSLDVRLRVRWGAPLRLRRRDLPDTALRCVDHQTTPSRSRVVAGRPGHRGPRRASSSPAELAGDGSRRPCTSRTAGSLSSTDLDVLTHALVVNALALHRHRQPSSDSLLPNAA